MSRDAFNEWYNGLVGFHMNSERIRNDIGGIGDGIDSTSLEKWMKVCWNTALEAAEEFNGVELTPLKATP